MLRILTPTAKRGWSDGGRHIVMAEKIRGRPLPHLRAWRMHKLLGQGELAEVSGLARATITRAEQGDTIVSFANIRKLAAALGISTDDLLHREPAGAGEE